MWRKPGVGKGRPAFISARPTKTRHEMKKFYLHLRVKFSLGCHAKTSLFRSSRGRWRPQGRGASGVPNAGARANANPFTMLTSGDNKSNSFLSCILLHRSLVLPLSRFNCDFRGGSSLITPSDRPPPLSRPVS